MQEPMQNSLPRQLLAGAQMLFVAFGALVLMPLITGMDPNVALFTAGIGTLLFQLVTGRQVPVFLASSFAFIAPILAAKTAFWHACGDGRHHRCRLHVCAAQSGRAAARGRLYRALAAAGGYCAGDYVYWPGTVAYSSEYGNGQIR
jgi:xanthine/uracil permease